MMEHLPVGLVLEGLLALLLGVTVFYCVMLDRRLRQLRSGQDGLRDVIRGLNGATERAQSSVTQLRLASDAATSDLQDRLVKARALVDELGLMVETGNNLADRLEGGRRPAEASAGSDPALSRIMRTPTHGTGDRGTVPGGDIGLAGGAAAPGPVAREQRPLRPESLEDRLLQALRDAR